MNEHSLKYRVYCAARDGMATTLYSLLSDSSSVEANQIINEIVREEGQRQTPLIIAARNGHERVVKMLLSKFNPNLETEGIINTFGFYDVTKGATALWCAVNSGCLSVVKLLVKARADINHPTRDDSTPLRAACKNGSLSIVKYLVEHDANAITNKHNGTCLVTAASEGHLDVVSFLLKKKADPNVQTIDGMTALHCAAEKGHMSVLKKLLDCNARYSADHKGMTPIKYAAVNKHKDIVEYFLSRLEISKEEVIDAFELLGAMYAVQERFLDEAYVYLYWAMKIRYSDPDNVIEKKLIEPIPAYESWIESRNLLQLEALEGSENGLPMEGLTICERILGKDNPEVWFSVAFLGEQFACEGRFNRTIELYSRVLHLKQSNNVSIWRDLYGFVKVFWLMIHNEEVELTYDTVAQVLAAAVVELEQDKLRIASLDPDDDDDDNNSVIENTQSSMKATLVLITILTKTLDKSNEKETLDINRMVSRLSHLQLKLADGKTLLHVACNFDRCLYSRTYTEDCTRVLPDIEDASTEIVQLLIRCGADVNAMDHYRNTPFHLAVSRHETLSDCKTLQIIKDLTEAGAHVSCVINFEDTTHLHLDIIDRGVAEILKTQAKLSLTPLKCMAAIAVKSRRLSYRGRVPQAIESFIELHGTIFLKGPHP